MMSENKKMGLDSVRADTLVREYEVMSWERCTVPATEELTAAAAAVEADPNSGDAWMQKGHAFAHISMMREAAECYSRAIACDPFRWEFYRHRAHRFLSCWRFQDAAADFTIASRLNPDDWNVWYHLGLSWFLLRDYEKAEQAYRRCYALSKNDKDLIAVTDWLWMTLNRLGKSEEADALLVPIHPDMEAGSGTAYLARLLMYKGLKTPEELLAADPEKVADLEIITMGFGIGNYYLLHGQTERGYQVMEQVVRTGDASNGYFAFAYLACRVELDARKQA